MINKFIFTGRLTADPELRMTSGGVAVCTFTVANDTGYGDNEQTHFIDVVAWRGTAEALCKYCRKGDPVAVCGELHQRRWDDANGNKRSKLEVSAENIQFFLPPKSKDQMMPQSSPPMQQIHAVQQSVQMPLQQEIKQEVIYEEMTPESDLPF